MLLIVEFIDERLRLDVRAQLIHDGRLGELVVDVQLESHEVGRPTLAFYKLQRIPNRLGLAALTYAYTYIHT